MAGLCKIMYVSYEMLIRVSKAIVYRGGGNPGSELCNCKFMQTERKNLKRLVCLSVLPFCF